MFFFFLVELGVECLLLGSIYIFFIWFNSLKNVYYFVIKKEIKNSVNRCTHGYNMDFHEKFKTKRIVLYMLNDFF